MKPRDLQLTVILAILICLSATAHAGVRDTVYLEALSDLTLYEDTLGGLANGAGQHMFVGRTDVTSGGTRRRALIRFDIAGSIPAGAFISEATLTLNMSQTSSDSQLVELHSLTSMWTEGPSNPPGGEGGGDTSQSGDATWIHCSFPTNFWDTAGGDFDHFIADTTWVVGPGTYTWNSMYVPAAVKLWLDSPATNFGWILVGNEDTTKTTKRFDTRENPTPSLRPELMVVYLVPTWIPMPVQHDNVLYEDPAGSVSNGRGEHLVVGRTVAPTNVLRRSVISFNVGAAIPSGSQVLDARLTLYENLSTGGPATVSIHRQPLAGREGQSNAPGDETVGAPSTAFDATWIHRNYPDTFWTTPGGDYAPAPSASTVIDTMVGSYVFWDTNMVNDLQMWADSGSSNAGWLIKSDELTPGDLRRFGSRSNTDASQRPLLEVAFSDGCFIVVAGDVNLSGNITSADIIYLVNFVFKGLAAPLPCTANGDVNCSGAVTSADIIYLVMHVFKGQPAGCDICNDPNAQNCN